MRRALDLLDRASDAVATLAFAGFLIAILAQILYRYLGLSLIFSEELARLLNVYMVFIGVVVVTRRAGHLKIDILERLCAGSPRFLRILRRAHLALGLLFLLCLSVGSYQLAVANWNYRLSTIPWLSHGHFYLAPLLGSLLASTVLVIQLRLGPDPVEASEGVR